MIELKIKEIEFFENKEAKIKGGVNFYFVDRHYSGYLWLAQYQNGLIQIDADSNNLSDTQEYFDQIIDSAVDTEIGTDFEMSRTSERDYKKDPIQFDKCWIDLIWKPWELSGGGIDLHWEKGWETGRIELKLSKEGILQIDGQACGYEFCKAAFRAALAFHWKH